MKNVILTILLAASFGAKAETLSCKYLSRQAQVTDGFLMNLTAKFDCGGTITQFIGDNSYVSCKPQFALSKFTKKLAVGEQVSFDVANYTISTIDGGSQTIMMVRKAVSASGKILKPQTIIQHGSPVLCDPTQIEVSSF